MSIEFQTAYTHDMGIIDNEGNANFVDSVNEEQQEIKTLSPSNDANPEIIIENDDPLNNFEE